MGVVLQGMKNHLKHPFDILKNLVVPESQDSETLPQQVLAASVIILGHRDMLTAIQLDHEPGAQAGKVRDVGPDRPLPSKAIALQLLLPQVAPQPPLCVSGVAPQLPGALDHPLIHQRIIRISSPVTHVHDSPRAMPSPSREVLARGWFIARQSGAVHLLRWYFLGQQLLDRLAHFGRLPAGAFVHALGAAPAIGDGDFATF